MDLILWRHADALPQQGHQHDLDRALSAQGECQAERMAAWLNRRWLDGMRVLVSPAKRTRQTAAALERKVEIVPALAHDAPADAVLHAAGWPDADAPVLLVGHQPTLGLAAARLLTGTATPWSIRKGAVWWFRGRRSGHDASIEVVLHAAIPPELL